MLLNKICKDFPLKLSPQASELNSSLLMEKMQIGPPTPLPQPLGSGLLRRFAGLLSGMAVPFETVVGAASCIRRESQKGRNVPGGTSLGDCLPPSQACSLLRSQLVPPELGGGEARLGGCTSPVEKLFCMPGETERWRKQI